MAVKIRLKRMGKKRQPVYKIVAADVRSPRDGKYIEALGVYNPKTDPTTVNIKEDRALYWLSVGAQPTNTVKNLLSSQGILLKRNLIKQGLSEEQIEIRMSDWAKMQEAKFASKNKEETQTTIIEKVESNEAIEEKTSTDEEEAKIDSVTEVSGTASEKNPSSEENTGK